MKNVINILLLLLMMIIIVIRCSKSFDNSQIPIAPKDYRRSENFQPFIYQYSLEDLKTNFSEEVMQNASRQYQKVVNVNDNGKWKPTLESIDSHDTPEWFSDAKFGMFIDWGLWSVAGWAPKIEDKAMYPDWYEFRMYTDSIWIKYHEKNWGKDFQPDDFIKLFTASDYNPQKLAELAFESGMKYIIPFCKHHSGYSLWPTSFSHRNANIMGPKQDLIKPLVESCKDFGLKFGFYFSLEEWEYPLIGNNGHLVNRKWGGKIEPYTEDLERKSTGKIAVNNFFKDYIVPQATEFIDKYDPDILWYDGEWSTNVNDLKSFEISAYFYNNAEGRKEVAVNDRYGLVTNNSYYDKMPKTSRSDRNWLRFKGGDYFTSEFHDHEIKENQRPWEECRGISQSYGFNWQDTDANVLSTEAFIEMFIDIVSTGGNLLLLVNLDGQGKVPEVQEARLKDIGKWLSVNGEGIYNTRTFTTTSEGKVRFTRSKDNKTVYAITTFWPGKELKLKSIVPLEGANINLLGVEEPLSWTYNSQEGIIVKIPNKLQEVQNRPCKYAYTFRIENKKVK